MNCTSNQIHTFHQVGRVGKTAHYIGHFDGREMGVAYVARQVVYRDSLRDALLDQQGVESRNGVVVIDVGSHHRRRIGNQNIAGQVLLDSQCVVDHNSVVKPGVFLRANGIVSARTEIRKNIVAAGIDGGVGGGIIRKKQAMQKTEGRLLPNS